MHRFLFSRHRFIDKILGRVFLIHLLFWADFYCIFAGEIPETTDFLTLLRQNKWINDIVLTHCEFLSKANRKILYKVQYYLRKQHQVQKCITINLHTQEIQQFRLEMNERMKKKKLQRNSFPTAKGRGCNYHNTQLISIITNW